MNIKTIKKLRLAVEIAELFDYIPENTNENKAFINENVHCSVLKSDEMIDGILKDYIGWSVSDVTETLLRKIDEIDLK